MLAKSWVPGSPASVNVNETVAGWPIQRPVPMPVIVATPSLSEQRV